MLVSYSLVILHALYIYIYIYITGFGRFNWSPGRGRRARAACNDNDDDDDDDDDNDDDNNSTNNHLHYLSDTWLLNCAEQLQNPGSRNSIPVSAKRTLWIKEETGRNVSSLQTPNLGLDCSFCCWVAWPRLNVKRI